MLITNLKKHRFILMAFAFILFMYGNSSARLTKMVDFEVGYTSMEIIGDNYGKYPLNPDYDDPGIIGGSFDGPESGVQFVANIYLDTSKAWSIPVGFGCYFMNAVESFRYGDFLYEVHEHKTNVPYILTGINWAFYQFGYNTAQFYTGLEARLNFIQGSEYSYKHDYYLGENESKTYNLKGTAFRVGGIIKLGVEGHLLNNLFIDAHVGLGIVNLFGRDDSRGELFTPSKLTTFYIENKEVYVSTFHFALMLQLRI